MGECCVKQFIFDPNAFLENPFEVISVWSSFAPFVSWHWIVDRFPDNRVPFVNDNGSPLTKDSVRLAKLLVVSLCVIFAVFFLFSFFPFLFEEVTVLIHFPSECVSDWDVGNAGKVSAEDRV